MGLAAKFGRNMAENPKLKFKYLFLGMIATKKLWPAVLGLLALAAALDEQRGHTGRGFLTVTNSSSPGAPSTVPRLGHGLSETEPRDGMQLVEEKRALSAALFRTPDASIGVAVPVALLVVLALTCAYAFYLWWHRGLVSHLMSELSWSSAPAATALLVYLALLVTFDLAVKYEAERGQGTFSTPPIVVVLLAESCKWLVTLALLTRTRLCRPLTSESSEITATPLSWEGWLRVSVRLIPVSCAFTTNNLLVFFVLARVRMDAYAVWRNMSIMFTAFIWCFALHREMFVHQWVAVLACTLGACFNSMGADGTIVVDATILLVLFTALLSSVGAVFNEAAMKCEEGRLLDVDQTNVLLYSQSITLLLCGLFCMGLAEGFLAPASVYHTLTTISPAFWRIIAVQVVLGLTVSRVLKYADSVSKAIAGSLREVVIILVAPYVIVYTRYDLIAVGSAFLVGLAGLIFFVPGPPASPKEAVEAPLASSTAEKL